ncbi:MAG: prohibitin family protein [Synechococcus sp.]
MRSANPRPEFNLPEIPFWAYILGGLLFLLLTVGSQCFLIVPAGSRAVIFNSLTGLEDSPRGEGLHFLVPAIESPIFYDVRTQTYTMASQMSEGNVRGDDALRVLSSDGQQISLDVSVRYRLDPDKVSHLHQATGPRYLDKVIRPEVRTVVRNELALHQAIAVYSDERDQIQDAIEAQLVSKFANNDLILQDVFLRNVEFSNQFQTAIEQKQIAEQEKERERFLVEKAELEKQRAIIQAEGEASAIELKGKALQQNPEIVQLEYVRKLAPGTKAIITDSDKISNPAGLTGK